MILAEAPGSEESAKLRPLVGPSGHELRRQLNTVGINLDDCFKANVFSRQPDGNNLHLYSTSVEADQVREQGPLATNPVAYMDRAHSWELERLYAEIRACNPHIIIALGNTATWALGLGLGISALRGSVHTTSVTGRPVKVLPTYHPAMILRQWDHRVIALADLAKAERESHYPEVRFDNTELWLNPTLADIAEFDARFMRDARRCACDIETKRGQIDCVSFAPSPEYSISIPFWVEGPSPNYWPTVAEELAAWRWVHCWLERGDLVKCFQNGCYDLSYLPLTGCTPRNCSEDTMLLSHSLWSEMQKGLGFLGSIHANCPSWKQLNNLHKRKKEEFMKAND